MRDNFAEARLDVTEMRFRNAPSSPWEFRTLRARSPSRISPVQSRHLRKQFFGTSAYADVALRGARVMTFAKIPHKRAFKIFHDSGKPFNSTADARPRMPDVNSHEFANNSARTRNKFLLSRSVPQRFFPPRSKRTIRHFDSVSSGIALNAGKDGSGEKVFASRAVSLPPRPVAAVWDSRLLAFT